MPPPGVFRGQYVRAQFTSLLFHHIEFVIPLHPTLLQESSVKKPPPEPPKAATRPSTGRLASG